MQSVHLVGEEEDELYSGFNDYNEAFDTEVKKSATYCIYFAYEMPDSIC